jgi:hypothetical protein
MALIMATVVGVDYTLQSAVCLNIYTYIIYCNCHSLSLNEVPQHTLINTFFLS